MDGESSSGHRSVDDVPFAILATLYRDLRSAKVTGRKRFRGYSAKDQAESRRSVLTRSWLKIAELCGYNVDVLSKRRADDEFVPAQVFPPSESFKIICLLVPALDSVHAYLGMKETKLADAFVKALDLIPTGADAQWLKHHKEKEYRPQRWKQDAEIVDGNFATVLRAVLTDRCPTESSLTIGKVLKALDTMSKASRGRSRRIMRSANYGDYASKSENKSNEDKWQDGTEEAEDVRAVAIRDLIHAGTSQEVSEVSRIILKDVDIRLSEDMLLSWFHPGAKQHYTQIHDIHKLLKDCSDPNFEVGEASVQVGQYASVMLTMRPSRKYLDTICDNLRGYGSQVPSSRDEVEGSQRPYFIMEPKLDGERLQLHKWKSRPADDTTEEYCIKTFSRRGNESSAMYAGALRDVILSSVRAEDFILDGEIIIWDDLKATWLRFDEFREVTTAIAKRSVPEGCSYTVKYMVFDVLYVDQGRRKEGDSRRSGNMVIRLPLYQRRKLLEKLITEKEKPFGIGAKAKIEVVGMERGHDEKELTQALQRYETLGYEGVIAKHPDKPYVLAERSLDIAIKLKPDYFDGGIQDLDVLILGAKYSSSHGHRTQRAGRLSTFLVGVRSDSVELPRWKGQGEEWEQKMRKCKWIPVGSIGTGYSDKDLSDLQRVFQGEWKTFNPKELPEHFEKREYAPTLLPEVVRWIEPWKSVVVTIRAFEVNPRYSALRFPRMERVNWDKPYYDVATFSELLVLDENKMPASIRPDDADIDDVSILAVRKKSKKVFDADEEEALNRVKDEGHMITGGRSARKVIASALGANVSNVERICSAFEGLSFYVVATDSEPKERVEVQIHQLGGKFVQNFSSAVDYVICTRSNLTKVKRFKERFEKTFGEEGTCPIIRSNWIGQCLEQKEQVLPSLNDVEYATASLESKLFEKTDRFGDPWKEDTDVPSLERSLKEVERWRRDKGQKEEETFVDEIEIEVRRSARRAGQIFDGLLVSVPETSLKLPGSVCLLKSLGARIVEFGDAYATHALVHSSLREKWGKENPGCNAAIITERWVQNCISTETLCPFEE